MIENNIRNDKEMKWSKHQDTGIQDCETYEHINIKIIN